MHEMRYENVAAALEGQDIPDEIRDSLVLIDIPFHSFEGDTNIGQIVIHKDLENDVRQIFEQFLVARFPIERIVPIHAYGFDDERSMQDNNTSAFNYRVIADTTTISNHALGRAIDINPRMNPSYLASGRVLPEGGTYEPDIPGTITADSLVVRLFKERGWRWLGNREGTPDYQHFDKAA